MARFKKGSGDWTRYRNLGDYWEIDAYHTGDTIPAPPYHERMQQVYDGALKVLKKAQKQEKDYAIFTHGHSTSRRGKTTCRSQIRKLMRSSDATPYIIRPECIQHRSVFVAAIKPKE